MVSSLSAVNISEIQSLRRAIHMVAIDGDDEDDEYECCQNCAAVIIRAATEDLTDKKRIARLNTKIKRELR
jgi:hypothetical protein